jgi:formate-dependent nitrite reductase membrane component NrfD
MIASYLWTKSIAAGVLLVAALLSSLGTLRGTALLNLASPLLALLFLGATVLLLIFDLKRPERFLFLLLKPNFKSWLVLGGYILLCYGILASLWLFWGFTRGAVPAVLLWLAAMLAAGSAGYSAFLFAQAKARDFWQSPLFLWHLLIQAITAGSAILIMFAALLHAGSTVIETLAKMMSGSLTLTLAVILGEFWLTPVSEDVKRATDLLKRGALSGRFWAGVIGVGVLLPIVLLLWSIFATVDYAAPLCFLASVLALIGLWIFEDLWVEAGQAVPLS